MSRITPKVETASAVIYDSHKNQGLYIPVYQRKFTWGGEQFTRLFDDITDVISQPLKVAKKAENYKHYFGSVIYYSDEDKKYVCPKNDSDKPRVVYNIVDGQQRLTTIILITTILIRMQKSQFNKIKRCKLDVQEMSKLTSLHEKMIEFLQKFHSLKFNDKQVPKIIRSLSDIWSDNLTSENYRSPVADYLVKYISTSNNLRPVTLPKSTGEMEAFRKQYALLTRTTKEFCMCSDNLANKFKLNKKLNDLNFLTHNPELMFSLFGDEYSAIDVDSLDTATRREYECFMRGLMLGYFINNCLKFVSLEVHDDYNQALTIFDSLNSTGRPLTPLECLKPEIISSLPDKDKDQSEVDLEMLLSDLRLTLFREIESIVRKITVDDEEKIAVEKTIVTIFSLVLSGSVLAGSPAVQRAELIDKYKEMGTKDNQVNYLKLLRAVAKVYLVYYNNEEYQVSYLGNGTDEALLAEANFCMNYLKEARCHLGLALVSRYYYDMVEGNTSMATVCEVIKASASFFAIWQSCDQFTRGKDDVFRAAFKSETPDNSSEKIVVNPGKYNASFFDFNKLKVRLLSRNEELNNYYRSNLELRINRNVEKKNSICWRNKSKVAPMFIYAKATAKFFILIEYYSECNSDSDEPITTIPGDAFSFDGNKNLSHIVPDSIFEGHRAYEQLWNLTVFPEVITKYLKKLTTVQIKRFYEIASIDDDDQFNEQIQVYTNEDKKIIIDARTIIKWRDGLKMIRQAIHYPFLDSDPGGAIGKAMKWSEGALKLIWIKICTEWLGWESND